MRNSTKRVAYVRKSGVQMACVQLYLTMPVHERLLGIAEREEVSVAEVVRRMIRRDLKELDRGAA